MDFTFERYASTYVRGLHHFVARSRAFWAFRNHAKLIQALVNGAIAIVIPHIQSLTRRATGSWIGRTRVLFANGWQRAVAFVFFLFFRMTGIASRGRDRVACFWDAFEFRAAAAASIFSRNFDDLLAFAAFGNRV